LYNNFQACPKRYWLTHQLLLKITLLKCFQNKSPQHQNYDNLSLHDQFVKETALYLTDQKQPTKNIHKAPPSTKQKNKAKKQQNSNKSILLLKKKQHLQEKAAFKWKTILAQNTNYFEQAVNKTRWKIRLCLTIRRVRFQSFNKEERWESLSAFNVKLD